MRKWVLVYGALACGCVALLLLMIWAMGGLDDLKSLSHDGFVALILAVSITVLLSMLLMGLSFYSARRGVDDKVMEGDSAPHDRSRKQN
jgi:predicted transporter